MTALFEIGNLSASYGKVQAVRGVSINVDAGEIVTIIGPNGAGKTTLLSAIMGLMNSTGSISFNGEDMMTLDVEARVERGICLVPERRELFGEMTVADNLLLGAYTHRSDSARVRSDFDAVYQRFPRLAERRAQVANTLSGGERQMLALGRALMTRPKVLMLDEPSLGLAPLIVREIFKIISSLRELGVAVFLVEQNARAALETANRGYVLEMGEVTITGPAKDLMHDPRVAQTYLGGAA